MKLASAPQLNSPSGVAAALAHACLDRSFWTISTSYLQHSAQTNDHVLECDSKHSSSSSSKPVAVQYYDDTAGILRSVILSAIAPHRLSATPLPQGDLQSFGRQDSAQGAGVLPMVSPMQEPLFSGYEDEMEDL